MKIFNFHLANNVVNSLKAENDISNFWQYDLWSSRESPSSGSAVVDFELFLRIFEYFFKTLFFASELWLFARKPRKSDSALAVAEFETWAHFQKVVENNEAVQASMLTEEREVSSISKFHNVSFELLDGKIKGKSPKRTTNVVASILRSTLAALSLLFESS